MKVCLFVLFFLFGFNIKKRPIVWLGRASIETEVYIFEETIDLFLALCLALLFVLHCVRSVFILQDMLPETENVPKQNHLMFHA